MGILNPITINLGQGGTGQPSAGTDYITGLQLYGTGPGSFATTACQAVYSVADAVSKGIVNTHLGETAATGTYLITTKGNTGDTINATISIPVPVTEDVPSGVVTVDTGTYTVGSSETTIAAQGAAWAAIINAGTYSHGFTASFATATLTITAKAGLGVSLNSGTPIAITITGAFVGTLTQFSGGAYSKCDIWYYHVSEYFRQNPNGKLWINFTSAPSSNFAELTTLINSAQGECKRIGVYSFTARTVAQVASDLTAMQAIAVSAFAAYKSAAIIYAPNIAAVSDLSTLYNGQNYSNYNTAVCISQDGAAAGAALYVNSGVSITNIGCVLGVSSKAAVSQDIGEVQAFNISNGVEMNIPAFSNSTKVSSVASSLLDQLNGYRYIFAINYTGKAGTYISNDWTYCVQTNDYLRLSRILVINKVARNLYASLLDLLKSRIQRNSDGTMTALTIGLYKNAIEPAMTAIRNAGDISAYAIAIDPAQVVTAETGVTVSVSIVPVDIADAITVNLTFVPKL